MPNHVWSCDFVEDRIHDGRKFRMMCLIDEFIHEALAGQAKSLLHRLWETLAGGMISYAARRHMFRSITGRSSSPWSCVSSIEHGSPWTTAILIHRDGLPPPTSCRSPGILDSQRL